MSTTPITVTAEILVGKVDPSAEARFANANRAGQYAQMLVDTGDYAAVYLDDGDNRWLVGPSSAGG
ncbi:hypothetical protein [Mycolicibacterium fortuitum]|uniref:hypothetical protein n=1 Tax=Mycolicibacterium fortuitum TaxID=1766 RepID=UPI002603AA74|nr:hypothetical protein [Mycolicibacterium fortuitum]